MLGQEIQNSEPSKKLCGHLLNNESDLGSSSTKNGSFYVWAARFLNKEEI